MPWSVTPCNVMDMSIQPPEVTCGQLNRYVMFSGCSGNVNRDEVSRIYLQVICRLSMQFDIQTYYILPSIYFLFPSPFPSSFLSHTFPPFSLTPFLLSLSHLSCFIPFASLPLSHSLTAPTLSFQSDPLVISETEGSSFTILRYGVNLHLPTHVCYRVLHNETSTPAVAGKDFTLISRVSQTHDQSCVTFAANQTEALCPIIAYEDNMLEETEFVFLELLDSHLWYGELRRPIFLNVTILDKTERTYVYI